MKLVLEEYLKTLKEKDELDFLLCDLLMLDGYIVNTIPRNGERQYGVDICARKNDELYLFVIKQKNIDRTSWDSVPDGVRASFDEILDCGINLFLTDKEKAVHIILATNGTVSGHLRQNFNGFQNRYKEVAGVPLDFQEWNISQLVDLCEKLAFNEILFPSKVQSLLRKALYYIDELNFTNTYFERIVDYYINCFEELDKNIKKRNKALISFYTCITMINQWIKESKQYKKSIDLTEYSLISFWRYICKFEKYKDKDIEKCLLRLLDLYEENNYLFFDEIKQICNTDNGLRSINIFESRFLTLDVASRLSLFGLYLAENENINKQIISEIYNTLLRLLKNNPSYKYPLYDNNIIELSFIYLFLKKMDKENSDNFIRILFLGIRENYHINHVIPSPSDDYEEVLSIYLDRNLPLYDASILFGTMLEWACCAEIEDMFKAIEEFIEAEFKDMVCQSWQISLSEENDFFSHDAVFNIGMGVPFYLSGDIQDFKNILKALDKNVDFKNFKSNLYSFSIILLISSRYFHAPVLPQFWRA